MTQRDHENKSLQALSLMKRETKSLHSIFMTEDYQHRRTKRLTCKLFIVYNNRKRYNILTFTRRFLWYGKEKEE